jgi:pimeloyl-ACP methyl ester carboxylesterase
MANSHVLVGTGPRRVIALHGWFGSASGWGPMVESLDTDAFTYAFMDYRGYGASQSLTGEFSMAEIAGDTLALADPLVWDRFSLVGHSMGGMAIQRVLLAAPQRVERMVAITPVPSSGVPFDDATWGMFSSAATTAAVRKGILDYSTGQRLSGRWLDRMTAHSLANATEAAFAAYLVAWAKTDFASQLAANPIAIKVIVGEHDPSLTADVMRATYLATYPNAELEVMSNAGHYPMDETPVALATSMERFLAA